MWIKSILAKYCHHSIKVFEFHLKWKLKEQLAKDPPEIIPCSQDCVENWMFSWTIWISVEVLCWIALNPAAEPAEFTGANTGRRATWGLLRLTNSVIAEDMSWNCSNVGRSFYDSKLASLLWPVTALIWRLFMFLDDKILTVVDVTQWLVNGGLIPARTDLFFIMWPIALWPSGTVEYQMTSDDGLNLAPLKGFWNRDSHFEFKWDRYAFTTTTGQWASPLLSNILPSDGSSLPSKPPWLFFFFLKILLQALLCLVHNIPGRNSGFWKASGLILSAAAGFLSLFDQSRVLWKTRLFVLAFLGRGCSHLPVRQFSRAIHTEH